MSLYENTITPALCRDKQSVSEYTWRWVKSGPTSDAVGPHLNQRFVYGSDSLSYSDVNVTRVMSCHTVEQTQHSNKHRNVMFFI